MSDELLDRLADQLTPVRRGTVRAWLVVAVVAGVLAAAAIMVPWLGLRPDLARAVTTPIFWSKFAFTLVLLGLGFWAAHRLARPGGSLRAPVFGVLGLIAVTAAAGIVQILLAEPGRVRALVLGGSALVCPFYIVALSLPVLVAAVLVMRRLAPTNLPAAGFAAGLLAGAAGAWVYAFHCTESGLPFITLWYTTGILAAALIGAALGRWLLRW
ncbi:MAG TPA: DUF1109 domain-containing protein [Devosia sp.]